jgi:hypothetical protein
LMIVMVMVVVAVVVTHRRMLNKSLETQSVSILTVSVATMQSEPPALHFAAPMVGIYV